MPGTWLRPLNCCRAWRSGPGPKGPLAWICGGFRSRHVLLLLDGIPLNSTFDGQFDPSIIPTENIAKIKVSYGTSSVLYGQGALAGVINIITKKGTEGFQGKASGEVGEGLERLGRFNLSGAKEKCGFFPEREYGSAKRLSSVR